jgi:DNA-binding NarL/FixJ family response regulator
MPRRRTLTARELDVLCLVADGRTDAEVAADLGIARRTVSRHVSTILEKLDASSRTEASTAAITRSLIRFDHRLQRFVKRDEPAERNDPGGRLRR